MLPELPGDLEQGRGAGRVVVGAVVDGVRLGIETPGSPEPQVIVMGADDHIFLAERRVASGEDADHVPAPRAAEWGSVGRGRGRRHGEGLEPAACGRREPEGRKPPGNVLGGAVGPRRSYATAFEAVRREERDIGGDGGGLGVEGSWKRDGGKDQRHAGQGEARLDLHHDTHLNSRDTELTTMDHTLKPLSRHRR